MESLRCTLPFMSHNFLPWPILCCIVFINKTFCSYWNMHSVKITRAIVQASVCLIAGIHYIDNALTSKLYERKRHVFATNLKPNNCWTKSTIALSSLLIYFENETNNSEFTFNHFMTAWILFSNMWSACNHIHAKNIKQTLSWWPWDVLLRRNLPAGLVMFWWPHGKYGVMSVCDLVKVIDRPI